MSSFDPMPEDDVAIDIDTSAPGLTPSAKPRYRLRFSLLTLMLVSAAICVWAVYFRMRYTIPLLEAKIVALESFSNELVANDPTRIAVVRAPIEWMGEEKWKVLVPPRARPYRLCVATQNLTRDARGRRPDEGKPPRGVVDLSKGLHEVQMKMQRRRNDWRIRIMVDGEVAIDLTEPLNWNPSFGSTGGSYHERPFQPTSAEGVVVLYFEKFLQEQGPNAFASMRGPGPGLRLWLEPQDSP